MSTYAEHHLFLSLVTVDVSHSVSSVITHHVTSSTFLWKCPCILSPWRTLKRKTVKGQTDPNTDQTPLGTVFSHVVDTLIISNG